MMTAKTVNNFSKKILFSQRFLKSLRQCRKLNSKYQFLLLFLLLNCIPFKVRNISSKLKIFFFTLLENEYFFLISHDNSYKLDFKIYRVYFRKKKTK